MRHKRSHGTAVSPPSRPRSFPPRRGHGVQEAHYRRYAHRPDRPHGESLRGLHVVGRLTSQGAPLPRGQARKDLRCGQGPPPHPRRQAPSSLRQGARGATLPGCQARASLRRPQESTLVPSSPAHPDARPSRHATVGGPAVVGQQRLARFLDDRGQRRSGQHALGGRYAHLPSVVDRGSRRPHDRAWGQGCLVRGEAHVSLPHRDES